MKRGRGGFALAAVLAALVLTMMIVAVSAQRALLAVRQAEFAEQRVTLEAAAAMARDLLLGVTTDSAVLRRTTPGSRLAAGQAVVGRAQADWELRLGALPYSVGHVTAFVASARGRAALRSQLIVTGVSDSAGRIHWSPSGAVGWVRIPSP